MTPVAIALGGNLGDRDALLKQAIAALSPYVIHLRQSSFHRTAPVGVGEQPEFLNAVVAGETALSARNLLTQLLDIERHFGRERPFPGAPRTLDLDLILFGSAIIDEPPSLIVPHPRFRERSFVLDPLAEVADDWVDPVTRLTVGQLKTRLSDVNGPDPHSA